MANLLDTLAGQPLALVVFAAVLALIFGVRYLGLWQGQNASPAASASTASVAAVIVDPTALNHATAAVEGLTMAIMGGVHVAREQAKNSERLAEEMDKVREEMRIHREVRRR